MHWLYRNAVGGLCLQVRPEDAERAREILAAPEPVADPTERAESRESAAEICLRCGSPETEPVQSRRRIGHLFWLFTGFPFLLPGRKRRCASCGLPISED